MRKGRGTVTRIQTCEWVFRHPPGCGVGENSQITIRDQLGALRKDSTSRANKDVRNERGS